nr:hypothetical protein [uncultured Brevundimonas sp.]
MSRLIRRQRPRDVVGWNGEPAAAPRLDSALKAHGFQPSKMALDENRPIFGPDHEMIGLRVNAIPLLRDLSDGLV